MAPSVPRRAYPDDAVAIADCFLASRADALPYLPVLHTDDETRAWFRDVVLPTQEVWVVDGQGEIAGFIAFDHEEIHHLYVRPGDQGRGHGGALLAVAKAQRPDGLALWAFQRNHPARRFYERRGFVAIDLTDGSANEEREPDARYAWRPT